MISVLFAAKNRVIAKTPDDIFYDMYQREFTESDALYQKASLMLVVLPLLWVGVTQLSRLDLIASHSSRPVVILLHLSAIVAIVFLIMSARGLLRFAQPRSKYKSISSPSKWKGWAHQYRDNNDLPEDVDLKSGREVSNDALLTAIIEQAMDCQSVNAQLNETRRMQFGKSVKWASWGAIAVGVQGFLHVIVQLQGL